jgi:hypothetical protein
MNYVVWMLQLLFNWFVCEKIPYNIFVSSSIYIWENDKNNQNGQGPVRLGVPFGASAAMCSDTP